MNNSAQRVAVLYGGSVGLSLLRDFASCGIATNFFTANPSTRAELRKHTALSVTGIEERKISLSQTQVCNTPIEACEGAEFIFIACPAFLHQELVRQIAPSLNPGQSLVLCPGRVFGAIDISFQIRALRPELAHCTPVVELETVPYACRVTSDSRLALYSKKDCVHYSFFNAHNVDLRFIAGLEKVMSAHSLRRKPLAHTSFNSMGLVLHPATMLLNAERILSTQEPLLFYQDLMTKEVGHFATMIDAERRAVAKAFGFDTVSLLEWLQYSYNVTAPDIREACLSIPAYGKILAPKELSHRYILEDVPYGLTPLSSLGKHLQISTPCMDQIIQRANDLMKTDFWKTGRSLQNIGLPPSELQTLFNDDQHRLLPLTKEPHDQHLVR